MSTDTAMPTATTTNNPVALCVEIERHLDEARRKLARLASYHQQPPPSAAGKAKLPDGRLDDAGVDALYADFAESTLTNSQLAAKHEISISGVLKRKAMWKRGRR